MEQSFIVPVAGDFAATESLPEQGAGVPMIELAVKAMLGAKLKDTEYGTGVYKEASKYAVKVPVFSGAKLINTDIALGPEMKSTGEALGIDSDLHKAFLKGYSAAGFKIMASEGTGEFLAGYGIDVKILEPEEAEKLAGKDINILINVANVGNRKGTEGLSLRRKAIEKGIAVLTCMDTAAVFLDVIKLKRLTPKKNLEIY